MVVGLRSVVTAISVAVVLSGVPAPAAAHEPRQPAPPGLRLELVEQALAFEADEPLRLRYRIAGDVPAGLVAALTAPAGALPTGDAGPGTPADPELVVQVTNYLPLTSPDGLEERIGSDVDRDTFGVALDGVEIAASAAAVAGPDGTVGLDLTIPTDSGRSEADRLRFDDPGLHPVRIELISRDAAGTPTVLASAGSVVQRLPVGGADPSASAVDLALVTAVEELPAGATDVERQRAHTAVDETLELASAVSPPVAAALPPTIVAARPSSSEPDPGRALLGDELVSVPAAPLDVSSAAAVDRVDAYSRLLRAGEDLLTEAVPTTPTRRDLWIATAPLSADGAQVLRDLGVRFVVMEPELYTATVGEPVPATDRFVSVTLPDGGSLPLLVVDDVGAGLVSGALPSGTTPTELAIATAAGILLDDPIVLGGTDAGETTRRSRIVAGPGFGPLDPELVEAVATITASTPSLRFAVASTLTGVTDLQRDDDGPLRIELPPRAGPDLGTRMARLDAAGLAMLSVSSMLSPDDPRPSEWETTLDSLISTAYTDDEVDRRVDDLLDEANRLKDAVVPPAPFTFTLTGRTGEIELPLVNRLPEPVRVVVHLESPKLVFPEGDTEVLLEPSSETRVVVPVRARANGTSSVSVEVRTPLGEDITETVRLTSRVNALTGIGQVVTGGLVVVLLTWWFTHWRSRRRRLALKAAERHPSHAG